MRNACIAIDFNINVDLQAHLKKNLEQWIQLVWNKHCIYDFKKLIALSDRYRYIATRVIMRVAETLKSTYITNHTLTYQQTLNLAESL